MRSVEELEIELCVLELRFNQAIMLWDTAGSIWNSMLQKCPELKLSAVLPNQQVFETESLQLVLELGLMRVNARGPKAIEEVKRNGSDLMKIATDRLKINSFNRAGFRLIRSKVFPTGSLAMKFASSDNQMESKAFGPEGKKVAFARSEKHDTEKAGLQAALRVEEREWAFNTPWESRPHLPANLSHKEWTVIIDSDYYTIGTVDRESLDVGTWIDQALKAIQSHWSGS